MLKEAYEKYHPAGLEIIGVSLDDDKAAWISAIKKDGLKWLQVSDLKEWENQVSRAYRIFSIPSNFLLDPKGKIIAKNLRGENLDQILSEVIKNKD